MSHWLRSVKALRCKQYIVFPGRQRTYSTSLPLERISVPCQSNGSITLDVHHAESGTTTRNGSPSVLIYLPRGVSSQDAEKDASNIALLRSNLPCPVVRINYRLSEHHKYPTPVHDMLCGLDWIVKNLLIRRGITRTGRAGSVGEMAVCGELIGGGLATALALTECRIGQAGIVAAAVSNPVVNWVSMTEAPKSKAKQLLSKKSSVEQRPTRAEHEWWCQQRARTFRKPEDYFDPFASPILFFRSPGAQVPPPAQDIPSDDLEQLSLLEREDYQQNDSGISRGQADAGPKTDDLQTPALRKASRRFPSKALGLRLPQFNISTSSTFPLRHQADELTHVLRQSHVRQSKNATLGYSDFGRKVLAEDEIDELDEDERALANRQAAEAQYKIELHVHEGSGGWSDDAHGRARLREAAVWLRHKLE